GGGLHLLLGLRALALGRGGVDLAGALRRVGEHRDPIVEDLGEARGDRIGARAPAALVGEDAGLQERDERRVSWQDAEVALGAGQLHLVRLGLDDLALRRDDDELERHPPYATFASCAAFSRASSIVPTM